MLHVFLGTDRQKAQGAMNTAAARLQISVTRISDGNPLGDLTAALQRGTNMFGEQRAIVLDSVCANEEMCGALLEALPALAASSDQFFLLEEKPGADLKKKLQKYAEKVETFDTAKKREYPTVFQLADHLRKADKKNLWVAYQRELAQGNAPEAIHGVLFWGAKQCMLGASAAKDIERARKLVAALTELPHESRRRGEELEYALERFILSAP